MLEYGEGIASNVESFFEICILSSVKKRNNNVSSAMTLLHMLVVTIHQLIFGGFLHITWIICTCHITYQGLECKVFLMLNVNDIAEQNFCSSLHNKCPFHCRCNEDESRPSNAESEQSDGSSVYKSSSSSANNSSTSSLTSDTVSTYFNLVSGYMGGRG